MIKNLSIQSHAATMGVLLLVSLFQTANAADWLYTMRPGDNIWNVCRQYTKEPTCWQKLGPLNNIARDRNIPPGTRIRIPAEWLKVPAASASIEFIQGDVRYQLLGEQEKKAEKGVKLPIGAKLITGQGSASLSFADGSSMLLEPDSQLELDTLSNFELNGMVDSTVRLNQGTVKTRVIKREPRSRFITITPSAVAAVRGTEYRVNVVAENPQNTDKQTTLVEVYQGLVDVGAESITFPVPANFGIVAKQGEAPQEPVKLLDKPEFMPFDAQQTLMRDMAGKVLKPIAIQWHKMDLASGYQLSIFADQEGNAKTEKLIKTYRINDQQVNIDDLQVGCYQLSLRAIDQLGLHGLAQKERLCLLEQLKTPAFQSLVNDEPSVPQVALSWESVIGAKMYRVDVSESADFSSLISSEEISDSRYLLMKKESTQFVRIQALGESGELSNYSQHIKVKPLEIIEKNDNWKMLVPIGLFILAIL